jgi:branched-chain amino acid transport system ATP-binding protein
MSGTFLNLSGLEVRYGNIVALRGLSIELQQSELVAVIGSNGAGKTTMLKAISGLVRPSEGTIIYQGRDISAVAAHRIAGLGIAHCPEGRKIFSVQSVEDNLILGAYLRTGKDSKIELQKDQDRIFEIFPILKERRKQQAGTLSGGQQQMLAIGRALMSKPKLLMLDEPSMGLAPVIIDEVFKVIKDLHARKEVSILLVEQLAYRALQVADRAYVLEQGKVRLQGTGKDLLTNPEVQKAYLGAQA